jgi:hypothetical protein
MYSPATPAPEVTGGSSDAVAWIALGISAVAAVAAIVALIQSSYFHPKPYLVLGYDREYIRDSSPRFTLLLTNMGKDSAHDVQLRIARPGSEPELAVEMVEMPVSEVVRNRVSTVTGNTKSKFTTNGPEYPKGAPQDLELHVHLTWRQGPTMSRERVNMVVIRVEDGGVGGDVVPWWAWREKRRVLTSFS